MKILENSYTQPDSKVLVDTDSARIEQLKLTDSLSTATITIHGKQQYVFTARSGILSTYVGTGTISTGSEQTDLSMLNKIVLSHGERVTLTNALDIPLILNFISAN